MRPEAAGVTRTMNEGGLRKLCSNWSDVSFGTRRPGRRRRTVHDVAASVTAYIMVRRRLGYMVHTRECVILNEGTKCEVAMSSVGRRPPSDRRAWWPSLHRSENYFRSGRFSLNFAREQPREHVYSGKHVAQKLCQGDQNGLLSSDRRSHSQPSPSNKRFPVVQKAS